MTRDEAAKRWEWVIENFNDFSVYLWPDQRQELLASIALLRGTQPDPDTGLKGCWHCRNIEAHHIEYVIAVKAKGGTPMNTPVDCPYHYCPACGRKLEVEG